MHDDRPVEVAEQLCGFLRGRACVDDHRLAQALREPKLFHEDAALFVTRCVVAVEVEADLADRDDLPGDQLPERLQ